MQRLACGSVDDTAMPPDMEYYLVNFDVLTYCLSCGLGIGRSTLSGWIGAGQLFQLNNVPGTAASSKVVVWTKLPLDALSSS